MHITGIPLFSGLSPSESETVEQLLVTKRFSRGQIVLYEEESSNYMYIIFSGRVRVVQLSEEGKEHILAMHRRGEYFGELSLFDGKTSPATVIAMEDSEIGLLSKNDFELFILKDKEVLQHFLTVLCSRLRESWQMLRIMSFADAEEKVRAVLRNIGKLYGVKNQGGVLVALKMTHNDIANYASVSRETVTRLMKRFTEDGEIEILDNRHILIKPTFLKKYH